MFGSPQLLAIEIGEVLENWENCGPFVQIRFVVCGHQIGDWEDRVPLEPSIKCTADFHICKAFRRNDSLKDVSSSELFSVTYDAFYDYDYTTSPVLIPNFLDRFHLSEVAMGATRDKFGIVVVDVTDSLARIAVKDLRTDEIIVDREIPVHAVDEVCESYMSWGEDLIRRVRRV